MIISVIIAPTYGCDAITDDGTCFTHFTSSKISWYIARQQCISLGYNLATVKNPQENSLLYSTRTSSSSTDCWIGLNDENSEGTFVWPDGSDSLYRNWRVGQPDDYRNAEDCVHFWDKADWNDRSCTHTLACFFCSTSGKNI